MYKLLAWDLNTWNHITVFKLFALGRNTWYHTSLCKKGLLADKENAREPNSDYNQIIIANETNFDINKPIKSWFAIKQMNPTKIKPTNL